MAEIRADLVVQCILDAINNEASSSNSKTFTTDDLEERIDWWLEEGGDEYVLFI